MECTFPLDQGAGMAALFSCSVLQGFFLMIMEPVLSQPVSSEDLSIQTCVEPGDLTHQQPMNYDNYLYFIGAYISLPALIYTVFFKTHLHRTDMDKQRTVSNEEEGESFQRT